MGKNSVAGSFSAARTTKERAAGRQPGDEPINKLAAGGLYLVALRAKRIDQHITMVALNLDHAVLCSSTGSQLPLEIARQFAQLGFGERNSGDGGDGFAPAPFDFTPNSHDSITTAHARRASADAFVRCVAAVRADPANPGGINQIAIAPCGHGTPSFVVFFAMEEIQSLDTLDSGGYCTPPCAPRTASISS
jgi:hypothetical protein